MTALAALDQLRATMVEVLTQFHAEIARLTHENRVLAAEAARLRELLALGRPTGTRKNDT